MILMTTTLNTNAIATPIKITTNNRERELVSLASIPEKDRADFSYIVGEDAYSPRLFRFRDAWWDVNEFERTEGSIAERGWHGVQTQSAFDAVFVRYPGLAEGDTSAVVVGHGSW